MPPEYTPKTMVPWVTRRVTEKPPHSFKDASVMLGLDSKGEPVQVLHCGGAWRDEQGWLWQPAVTDQSGAPEWTQVHPERQRRCMDEGRCQVCGEQADVLLWRIAKQDVEEYGVVEVDGARVPLRKLRATTYTPPVCERCEPVARRLCPHLRKHADEWQTYTAERVVWAGVVGDVYNERGERARHGWVKRFSGEANMTLARQRVVRLYGLVAV